MNGRPRPCGRRGGPRGYRPHAGKWRGQSTCRPFWASIGGVPPSRPRQPRQRPHQSRRRYSQTVSRRPAWERRRELAVTQAEAEPGWSYRRLWPLLIPLARFATVGVSALVLLVGISFYFELYPTTPYRDSFWLAISAAAPVVALAAI